jgi:hypothetical protein
VTNWRFWGVNSAFLKQFGAWERLTRQDPDMNRERSWTEIFCALVLAWYPITIMPSAASGASGDKDSETTETYYWQGNQLNNLNRLGGSPDFEQEQRHLKEGKEADSYLATIREQMQRQAAADAKNGNTLVFQGLSADSPIELTYTPSGIRLTLHMEALFDENSSAVKIGAVDTLVRVRNLLLNQGDKPIQLVLYDKIEDVPDVNALDAERSLYVVSLLDFPSKSAGQENLTPEPLSQ